MGIFMATLTRSMPQFALLMILTRLPLQRLSGGSAPRETMPQIVQTLMLAAPTTHFTLAAARGAAGAAGDQRRVLRRRAAAVQAHDQPDGVVGRTRRHKRRPARRVRGERRSVVEPPPAAPTCFGPSPDSVADHQDCKLNQERGAVHSKSDTRAPLNKRLRHGRAAQHPAFPSA